MVAILKNYSKYFSSITYEAVKLFFVAKQFPILIQIP